MVVDETGVYWTSLDGRVHQANLDGSGSRVLVPYVSHPRGLAIDGTYVYFAAEHERAVFRVPKAGGLIEVMAPSQALPYAVAESGDYVYWSNTEDSTISRMHK